jgi:signal transduction histidine kinase
MMENPSASELSVSELYDLERLAVLEAAALLDTPAEEVFDQFTRLASTILQTPVALVSLVDRNRQFFKSSVGLSEPWASRRQTPLSHSFCKHVVSSSEPLSVSDARAHPLLRDNLAIAELGVIAYLGIPLTTSQGFTLGSFCVIDGKPREWTSREIEILRDLATLVIDKIELRLLAKQLHVDYLNLRSLELYHEEMVHMLIHDMRNPLTAFLGGMELMQKVGELTDRQKQFVDMAQQGGNMLLQMISSILDASQTETRLIALQLADVIPTQILADACEQMAPLAEKAGVQLHWSTICDQPHQADAGKLHRVLVNLISNAIQHTPVGGTVTVGAQVEAENMIRFSVADMGQGIPAEAFEQIFKKFGRVKTHRVTGASTGLGLPFSRMVVEAHGGRIWVESELNHGTSFYFTLPAFDQSPEA